MRKHNYINAILICGILLSGGMPLEAKYVPSKLNEVVLEEAIVIEDEDEDLWKSADGTEPDYPKNADYRVLPDIYLSTLVEDKEYVTSVKNQGYTSLCWAFSSIGAVECNLLTHHEELEAKDINLSEKHAAYYNLHKSEGSINRGIDNDYRELVFSGQKDEWIDEYDTGYLSTGGITDYCLSLFTSWKGPVFDKGKDSIKVIKGSTMLYTDNDEVPSDAYDNSFCHVQGVYEVPANKKNRNFIKRLIIEHGGVTCSVCADKKYFINHSEALYDYKKYGGDNVADHEVLIVGWDDKYPASGFVTNAKEDGAFICKNSWGTGKGKEGYFYLSYDDEILKNNNVAAYDCALEGDRNYYDNNYQYAGFINQVNDAIVDQDNVVYALEDNNKAYGAVYSAAGKEKLSAVGFFSDIVNSQYLIEVYRLNKDFVKEDLISFDKLNDPVVSMECHSITGGFHTFPIADTVLLEKNDKFLVMIRPSKKQKTVFEKQMDSTAHVNYDEWNQNIGAMHTHNEASGNCYLEDATGKYMVRQKDKDFFVKAYTNNR